MVTVVKIHSEWATVAAEVDTTQTPQRRLSDTRTTALLTGMKETVPDATWT